MPLNEPASDQDWQGGPPMIPSISSGKSSSFILRISPSMRRVLGWLILKVSQMVLSYSLATGISNPAFSNPRSKPPHPQNKLITFIFSFH